MSFVDRRPIFTVGQVWTDFVKRLPRDYPRYRGEVAQMPGFAAMQQAQNMAALPPNLFGQYLMPQQYHPTYYGIGGLPLYR